MYDIETASSLLSQAADLASNAQMHAEAHAHSFLREWAGSSLEAARDKVSGEINSNHLVSNDNLEISWYMLSKLMSALGVSNINELHSAASKYVKSILPEDVTLVLFVPSYPTGNPNMFTTMGFAYSPSCVSSAQ